MTLTAFLDPRGYPMLLPHVGYHHGEIYVGAERREAIASNEGLFLECCDGTKTLTEIAVYCNVTPDFISSIAHLCAWWPDPVTVATPDGADRPAPRLVLASSPEQPWLGMGGTLLHDASTVATCILSCFQVVPSLHGSFRTRSEAAMACADEAAVAARFAGVGLDQLRLPEAAARRETGVGDDLIVDILRVRIASKAASLRVRELFVPAGMAYNLDAQLLFEAVLSLIGDGLLTCDVHIYADQSAAQGERNVDNLHARFERSYLMLRENSRNIEAQGTRKEALLRMFRHRVEGLQRREWRDGAVLNAVRTGQQESHHVERFWALQFTELG